MSTLRRRITPPIIAFALAAMAWPSPADAHGRGAAIATSYLARISATPAGAQTNVIDGDQRMWLRVDPTQTIVVLDYRGAPYLRFSRAGVEVNRNSALYYLNLTPTEVPPSSLGRTTPPKWARVSGAPAYGWHDGRLHALAGTARLPGVAFIGTWRIPVLVDGRLRSIEGGLWHAPNPSIAWFWPIVVLLLCVLAARRVQRPALDGAVARALAAAALIGILAGAIGRQLHGRPDVSVWQLTLFGALIAFAAWAAARLLSRRQSPLLFFAVAVVSVWMGVELLPVLLHGFVLAAVPAFVARAATVVCLGCGAALLLVAFRVGDRPGGGEGSANARAAAVAGAVLAGMLLTGCGSAHRSAAGLPADLVAGSRPIGRGPSFHPGVSGPVIGACRRRLGPRVGVHVEVFAADRVVIVPSGIGTRPPRRYFAGRIAKASCYGDLVTLEPTGVVQLRPEARLHLADLLRSWGQPLSRRRLASFSARSVEVFVAGRRWRGDPGRVTLSPHAEIVLEVGPHVPPHRSYTFPPGT